MPTWPFNPSCHLPQPPLYTARSQPESARGPFLFWRSRFSSNGQSDELALSNDDLTSCGRISGPDEDEELSWRQQHFTEQP